MELTIKYLNEKYKEFNAIYFDNELSSVSLVITKAKHQLGKSYGRRRQISISTYYDRSENEYCTTLIHEMIHQWQWLKYQNVDHGNTFKSKAREIKIKSNGLYDIHRLSNVGSDKMRDENVKQCHIFVVEENGNYLVGRVNPKFLKEVTDCLHYNKLYNIRHYIVKSAKVQMMNESRKRFNYHTYTIERFVEEFGDIVTEVA